MESRFCHFGLIVTGAGERECLDQFFRGLCRGAACRFRVLRRISQRSPITSGKRELRMVGSGKRIPDRDAEEIGYPVRGFLRQGPRHFVLLLDDLEHSRREQAQAVFDRYRAAIDTVTPESLRERAAVHFLVYMLEAYFFADSAAINAVAGRRVLEADHEGDVETIRHPKGELRRRWPEFKETEHNPKIVPRLSLDRILADEATCAWLRSCVAWCIDRLAASGAVWDETLLARFQLPEGQKSRMTLLQ